MTRVDQRYTGVDRNARHFLRYKGEYNLAYDDDLDGVFNTAAIPLVLNGINLTASTMTQGLDNASIMIGTITTPKEVTITDDYVPLQVVLSSAGTPTDKTMGAAYFKTSNTEDATGLQLATCMVRTNVDYDLNDAYGVQSHLTIGTEMATGASLANITAGSFKTVLTGACTQGKVSAGLFILDGAAAVTETCNGVEICIENAVTTADNALVIDGSGTCATGINLNKTLATGIGFNGSFTTAAISMDGATFADGDHEIEMRNNVSGNKTVICSGTATDDAGIRAAVGADADISDGSVYMSCTDGGGALFVKKNDVWTEV